MIIFEDYKAFFFLQAQYNPLDNWMFEFERNILPDSLNYR